MNKLKDTILNGLPSFMSDYIQFARYKNRRFSDYEIYRAHVQGKKAIEIGGPTHLFKSSLPLYSCLASVDGVNFSEQTIWEGNISNGMKYKYFLSKTGRQYISEASEISAVESNSYDVVLSSNCLEHVANPLKALREWKRVLNGSGIIVLILPNKIYNFDHNRPDTTLAHLLEDDRNDVTEYDMTHFDEIMSLHDLDRDPWAGTYENFKKRSMKNFENRAFHHHIFDLKLCEDILKHTGFTVLNSFTADENHICLGSL